MRRSRIERVAGQLQAPFHALSAAPVFKHQDRDSNPNYLSQGQASCRLDDPGMGFSIVGEVGFEPTFPGGLNAAALPLAYSPAGGPSQVVLRAQAENVYRCVSPSSCDTHYAAVPGCLISHVFMVYQHRVRYPARLTGPPKYVARDSNPDRPD